MEIKDVMLYEKPKKYKSSYEKPICSCDNTSCTITGSKFIYLTQMHCLPLIDTNGNEHSHDLNRGQVKIDYSCGKSAIVKYVANCECGWNKNDK